MAGTVSRSTRLLAARRLRATARLALAALAALLATAPTAPAAMARGRVQPARCRGAHTEITRARAGQLRSAVLCLINDQRIADHLPPLVASAKLDRSAQGWTNVMVASDDFSHGSAFMDRISATGFDWSTVGENIATGYETAAAVVRGWMRSPEHCATILSPAYREVGTGVSARPIPRASSLLGTWTQDFGRLIDQPALSADEGPANACYRQ